MRCHYHSAVVLTAQSPWARNAVVNLWGMMQASCSCSSSLTLFVYAFLRAERWFCEMTVSTRAIDFLTTLLHV